MEAVIWIRESTEQSAVVMAAYETGNLVAARAGNRVFTGHWAETVEWAEKFEQAARFYDEMSTDLWRQELMEEFDIVYVWHGQKERETGGYDPAQAAYLKPVFENADVVIYAHRE